MEMTNPLGLTPEQLDKLVSLLGNLCDKGAITNSDQYDLIYDTLLGIEMTPEETEYERRNTSSVDKPAPTPTPEASSGV